MYAVINDYDYVFAENGLVAYKDGKLVGTQVLAKTQIFSRQKFKIFSRNITFVTHPPYLLYLPFGIFN